MHGAQGAVPWSAYEGNVLKLNGIFVSNFTPFSVAFPVTGYTFYSAKVVETNDDIIEKPVAEISTLTN